MKPFNLLRCVSTYAILLIANMAFATTWQIGPTRSFTMPSQVSTLVSDGDTVEIDAGIYESDVARWSANGLVLRSAFGNAHLKANGNAYGGKAIWVIAGDDTVVEGLEFSGCSVPDQNGAGIRQEGHNLTIRNCYFHDNENGILAGTVNPSTIVIEHTEFGQNGYGDGQSHNIYINNIDSLIFRYNYSHGCIVGHELKSRAHVNFILYNRIGNESTGTGSRNIDLPNGGIAYLIGNIIEQGPLSENHNLIGYGLEGLNNPMPHEFYAVNNTIFNNYPGGSFFHINEQTALFKAYNNIMAGAGSFIVGDVPQSLDTASNIMSQDIPSFNFADLLQYNYAITDASSAAVNKGAAPGSANGFSLVPNMVYAHPTNVLPRCTDQTIDVGAYELCTPSGASEQAIDEKMVVFPNPANDVVQLSLEGVQVGQAEVYSLLGQRMMTAEVLDKINISGLTPGVYVLRVSSGDKKWFGKFAVQRQ